MDISKDKLLEMYRTMQKIRHFESKARDLAMAAELPSSHLNEPYAIFDDKWIAENAKMLEARYEAWKSSNP